ncbi:hypothetical protein FHS11_001072 [Mucilaginibacter gotjawali]|uniref:Uncharacterized protein n=1 Tax=Mucilaginibacter gotjawali TaxID=1550579 RepID=A0A839SBE5_9SPHI|nr:hypothetical protein [Mucilaginibacter gotjawali]
MLKAFLNLSQEGFFMDSIFYKRSNLFNLTVLLTAPRFKI